MLLEHVTGRELIQSLNSEICPVCGKAKKSGMTLCYGDYKALPKGMRNDLYKLVGNGYEEAFAAAAKELGVDQLHMPA